MKKLLFIFCLLFPVSISAQLGTRFPSERKVIKDPVTGVELEFLTTRPMGDHKTYQTHTQWTADGKWCVFNSRDRAKGNAIAVNEETGEMVQVTENGYMGKILLSRKEMKMYFLRADKDSQKKLKAMAGKPMDFNNRPKLDYEIIETDLAKLFADSESGKMKKASAYERVCGKLPYNLGVEGGDIALDANEDNIYFRIGKDYAASKIDPKIKIYENYGPRHMGAGPSGIAGINLKTGEIKDIVFVPFQVGHVQTNPWKPGEIIFCWETGGKAPQRTWMVEADGSGLQPIYKETEYDWVTHEAVISKDEVAIAILGHRPIKNANDTVSTHDPANPGQEAEWGPSGTREKATGLAIINLRTHEFTLAGQIPYGSGFWHVNGSSDGNWAVGDDFARDIFLIDRHTGERILLSTGHKVTAEDHPHPTFSADGTKIHIQSAMLSQDGKSLNMCVIKIPDYLLNRYKK